jgi:hypothetical protein
MTAAEVDKVDAANLHDEKITPLLIVKYIGSIGILIFSIILVGALMFTGNTRVSNETNPWVCLLVCVSHTLVPVFFVLSNSILTRNFAWIFGMHI